MKKKIVSFLAVVMTASMLAGCGNSDSANGTEATDNVGVTNATEQVGTTSATEATDSNATETIDNQETTNSSETTEIDVSTELLHEMDVDQYVTIGEYKGLEVTVEPISVDDSEVESLMQSAYNSVVTAENGGVVDRAVAVGDTANIDYVGKKDDVAFDGGTASGYHLTIGSGQFIDGFEDGLVGVMPGETVDLQLTFPEEYHSADLAGQEVVFTVTVNYIIPTEMKDEVVPNIGIEGVSTVEELRQYAYDYLYSSAEYDYTNDVDNGVLSTFMNNCVFNEIPQNIINKYEEMAKNGLAQQAQSYGMDVEAFVNQFYGRTLEEFLDIYGVEAAKQDISLQAVANRENLNLTEEELNATLQEYATNAGYATVEEFLGENTKDTYRDYLMCEKVLDFLVENAVVNN